jgi:hypothetical protein
MGLKNLSETLILLYARLNLSMPHENENLNNLLVYSIKGLTRAKSRSRDQIEVASSLEETWSQSRKSCLKFL